jgi:hypothetical protein
VCICPKWHIYPRSSWRDNPRKIINFLPIKKLATWVSKNLYVRHINYPVPSKLCIVEKLINIRNVLGELSLEKELHLFYFNKESQGIEKSNMTHTFKWFSNHEIYREKGEDI